MLRVVPRSAYHVLNVDPGASTDDIRRAYRQLARRAHPDLHGNSDEAHTRWVEIQLAYEVLIDPDRRARHDQGEESFENQDRFVLERRLAQLVRRRHRLRRLYE